MLSQAKKTRNSHLVAWSTLSSSSLISTTLADAPRSFNATRFFPPVSLACCRADFPFHLAGGAVSGLGLSLALSTWLFSSFPADSLADKGRFCKAGREPETWRAPSNPSFKPSLRFGGPSANLRRLFTIGLVSCRTIVAQNNLQYCRFARGRGINHRSCGIGRQENPSFNWISVVPRIQQMPLSRNSTSSLISRTC